MLKFSARELQFAKIVGETAQKKRIVIPYIYDENGRLRPAHDREYLTTSINRLATNTEKNQLFTDVRDTLYKDLTMDIFEAVWDSLKSKEYYEKKEKKLKSEIKRKKTEEMKFKKMLQKYKLPTSGERGSNKRKKERSTSTRKQCKTLDATINAGKKRWSDQKYYFTQYIFRNKIEKNTLPPNPPVTGEHRAEKLRIFGIADESTCIVTGMISSGAGDHMFEINGYAKKTGKHGRYDWWNTVPVVGKWNKRYKKIPVMGPNGPIKIDIGLSLLLDADIADSQLITTEQLSKATEEQQRLYNMFKEWKEYCIQQGASLYFEFDDDDDSFMAKKKALYLEMWHLE
tara:strand:- start:296 stop:1324 length:1029 start_codon:yes stop_codon:yes gene_type:complete